MADQQVQLDNLGWSTAVDIIRIEHLIAVE